MTIDEYPMALSILLKSLLLLMTLELIRPKTNPTEQTVTRLMATPAQTVGEKGLRRLK